MVVDRQRLAAYHNKHWANKLLWCTNADDFEWPWYHNKLVWCFFANL